MLSIYGEIVQINVQTNTLDYNKQTSLYEYFYITNYLASLHTYRPKLKARVFKDFDFLLFSSHFISYLLQLFNSLSIARRL